MRLLRSVPSYSTEPFLNFNEPPQLSYDRHPKPPKTRSTHQQSTAPMVNVGRWRLSHQGAGLRGQMGEDFTVISSRCTPAFIPPPTPIVQPASSPLLLAPTSSSPQHSRPLKHGCVCMHVKQACMSCMCVCVCVSRQNTSACRSAPNPSLTPHEPPLITRTYALRSRSDRRSSSASVGGPMMASTAARTSAGAWRSRFLVEGLAVRSRFLRPLPAEAPSSSASPPAAGSTAASDSARVWGRVGWGEAGTRKGGQLWRAVRVARQTKNGGKQSTFI